MKNWMLLVLIGLFMTVDISYADNENSQTNSGNEEGNSWYMLLGAGIADADICYGRHYYRNCINEDEIAFRFGGGVRDIFSLGPIDLGAEAAYANLGNALIAIEADTLELTATARANLPYDIDILVRAGGHYYDAIGDGTETTYAAGIEKDFGPAAVRVEYQRYNDIDGVDVDTYMVSGIWSF